MAAARPALHDSLSAIQAESDTPKARPCSRFGSAKVFFTRLHFPMPNPQYETGTLQQPADVHFLPTADLNEAAAVADASSAASFKSACEKRSYRVPRVAPGWRESRALLPSAPAGIADRWIWQPRPRGLILL